MAIDKPSRRLPLREMLTDAQKRIRDLIDKIGKNLLSHVAELRDLSRPARKRSTYPTLVVLHDALAEVLGLHDEAAEMIEYLTHELDEIRDHALRERNLP